MFKVEIVNPSPGLNDGDLVSISCSRKELKAIYEAIGVQEDGEVYGEIFHTIAMALMNPVNRLKTRSYEDVELPPQCKATEDDINRCIRTENHEGNHLSYTSSNTDLEWE